MKRIKRSRKNIYQIDYFKNGKMELVNPDLALAKTNQLEDHFIQNNLPIIYIQHIE